MWGRGQELADLRTGLAEKGDAAIVNPGAVLQGQGGVGKTTLARHYAEVYAKRYTGIVWATAETEGALAEALAGLAPHLGVTLDNLTLVQQGQAVIAAMGQDGRDWLAIYDNAPDYATIQNLVPPGHLIVTTRAATGWAGFAAVQAHALDYDTEDSAAVRVLMEAAGRRDDAAGARDLAAALGGLPLALVVAGALIRTEGYAFATYQTRITEVIAQAPKNDAYPDSVIGAVKLSHDSLGADARAVAGVLAHWAPEGLTPDLLTGAPDGAQWDAVKQDVSDETGALVSDPARVAAAFQALVDASLLARPGRADGGHTMHRMTAAALRALQAEDGAARTATELLAAVYPYDVQDSANWPLCRRLTPHVRALWATGVAPRGDALGFLLNQAGLFVNAIADYEGGLDLAKAGVELARALYGADHPNFAAARHNLALHRLNANDRAGAVAEMRVAVDLKETHQPGSATLAASYDQLGHILHAMAQAGQRDHLPEAIKMTQRGLALRRRLHGRWAEPVAASLNNLGALRRTQGRGGAAARLYAAALAIDRKTLPTGDTRIAIGAMNTGAEWLRAGRADAAEALLQEAVDIRRRAFEAEPDHPDLRTSAGWLISCLLVRAAAGQDTTRCQKEARALADEFGLDWAERQATARHYPQPPAG
ncbi:tetratricopeptide repeat protein [Salibaculum halophilum]|uniref:tetratricopeptide repeat protein n=1 Tax=Salibaculum halophilum TaxID=1914408 RepID=UPI0015C44FD2|nr:tetratricopeptide repeat protein [Salibaculum halophilum]